MDSAAIAAHAAMLAALAFLGLGALRMPLWALGWPALGLLAATITSATTAESPERAFLGIALALSIDGLIRDPRGPSPVTLIAGGGFLSLVAGLVLGLHRHLGFGVAAVAAGLAVAAPAAVRCRGRGSPAACRVAAAAGLLALTVPLWSLQLRMARLAPWATLPYALAILLVISHRGGCLAREERAAAPSSSGTKMQARPRDAGRAGAGEALTRAAAGELQVLLEQLRLLWRGGGGRGDRALWEPLAERFAGEMRWLVRALDASEEGEREPISVFDVSGLLAEATSCYRDAAAWGFPAVSLHGPEHLMVKGRRCEASLALASIVRHAVAGAVGCPGAAVRVSARREGGEVAIDICADTGATSQGLPPPPGSSAPGPSAAPREGQGLLLAARLLERTGGRAEVRSAEGGDCVLVFLPAGDEEPGRALPSGFGEAHAS